MAQNPDHFDSRRWIVVAAAGLSLAWPVSASGPSGSPPQRSSAPAASQAPAKPAPAPSATKPAPAAGKSTVPVYAPVPVSGELRKEFEQKSFKMDAASGNYLSPKVYSKTLHEDLVPVLIDGKYATDVRGKIVFLRKTVRDKLLEADAEMFKKNQHSSHALERHIIVNYGFRSNALQQELFVKLRGHGKVAPAGQSFHETGMALDVGNTKEAHKYLIHAGFVGGCDGIEEDAVHYSIGEISKASNFGTFRRCTIPGLFDHIPFLKKKK